MKIGYLPLYIKLYDDNGAKRDVMQKFYEDTTAIFREKGLCVVTSDFCRDGEQPNILRAFCETIFRTPRYLCKNRQGALFSWHSLKNDCKWYKS